MHALVGETLGLARISGAPIPLCQEADLAHPGTTESTTPRHGMISTQHFPLLPSRHRELLTTFRAVGKACVRREQVALQFQRFATAERRMKPSHAWKAQCPKEPNNSQRPATPLSSELLASEIDIGHACRG